MPRPLRRLLLLMTAALAVAAPHAVAAAPDAATADPAFTATAPTAAAIDAYLASKGSPMAGQGAAFIASGGRWQLDPRLVVAIAGAESSFGQITCAPFNAWGWGCPNGPYNFSSWADGIDTVNKGLRTNYVSEGRTSVALIHQKYAPVGAANDPTGLNNHWTINVSRFLVEMGGDPNSIALGGAAGTLPLGPTGGIGAVDEFGFEEPQAAGEQPADAALTVAVGTPRALVVRVRNTGSVAWRADEVRLRRIDAEARIGGAPFGALDSAKDVQPNAEARFVVQLAAVGTASGEATTTWRLESPSGPFGADIERRVAFEVPDFVAGPARSEVTAANSGVAGGEPASNVIVHVRNDGAVTWERDGDDAVLLGLVDAAGVPIQGEGWINQRAVGRMLERSAAPGEEASFAFRVRGADGVLALRPFHGDAWAAGDPILVEVGTVDDAQLEALRTRLAK